MIINLVSMCTQSFEAISPSTHATHAEHGHKWPAQCLIGPQAAKLHYIAYPLHE